MSSPRIRRALISTSDKLGLAQFAKGLDAAGVEIYSTGGTGEFLKAEGIAVHDVAAYTGFPEMLDGRVKTLHPKVHGGILARHDRPDDLAAIAQHGIVTFELVVITLYPFESTVARPQTTFDEAIEQIDVGGPSLIRAAAKNQAFVTVATDAEQYAEILDQISTTGSTTLELRRQLAQAAFARLSEYDRTIAAYLNQSVEQEVFPSTLVVRLMRKDLLRYGENPHQRGALYSLSDKFGANLVSSRQLSGKELSYNNLLDLDSALGIVRVLAGPSVVVIKHNNPCGASTAESLSVATRQALDGDPQSAFGSVLAVNRVVDAAAADVLVEPGRFIEAIVAPDFDAAALEILTTRPKWKDNVRLLRCGPLAIVPASIQYRQIEGGLLVQDADNQGDPEEEWRVVSRTLPGDAQWSDLRFAWALVRHVKSNAITVVKQKTLLGCGAGQMSRVDSVGLALAKAGERVAGAVMASDAFFPFADSIEQAAKAAITAVIQPGGSRRDEEVIAAADAHGMAMIFTGRRHFKH